MELFVFALVPVLAVFAAITWIAWQVLKGLRFLVVHLFGLFGLILRRNGGFLKTELLEISQLLGAAVTTVVLLPLTVLNFVSGRWTTARYYARAVGDEVASVGLGLYRAVFSHPLHFIGLGGVLEGLERRIPEVVDRAPRRASRRSALEFDGYQVTGTLPAGGSGALLYLARPKPDTVARLSAQGRDVPDEVVIKSFALVQGSTLPQIVRESRALEAANRLGLVLEHHLDPERFYYVMEYVRGDDLDVVVQRMHQRAGVEGLADREIGLVLGYAQDLVRSLDRFHTGGLWHKDVKPSNLIVSGERAHLVDFGLVTPLQSALTLTTHGTEYYRDPEMVRLAMQGVKVHEVDGVKFDLYSAGAVLFSMVENSFPAHGSLSSISKRCPEALAWVVRRAMADIGSRYENAREMLVDLAALAAAPDPFALRPADLPSVGGGRAAHTELDGDAEPEQPFARVEYASASPLGLRADGPLADDARRRRRRRVFVAGAASLLFISGATSFLHRARQGSAHAYRSPQVVLDSRGLEATTLAPGDRRVFRQAAAIIDEFGGGPSSEADAGSRPVGMRHSEPEPRSGPSEGLREFEGARTLVLDDLGNEAGVDVVRRLERYLDGQGLDVVDHDRIDVFADVRHAIGTGHVGDPDALTRLQDWLDHSDDLDIIFWVADGEDTRTLVKRGFLR